MRTLNPILLREQKKALTDVVTRIDIQGFSPRIASVYKQFDKLYWKSAYSDATVASYHGVTMPADGSLVRVRCLSTASNKLYVQRTTSPALDSTYTSWTAVDTTAGNYFPRPIAITSKGAEVFIFWLGYYDAPADWCLAYIKSTNSGASWGAVVYQKIYDISTGNSLPVSIAACHNGATAFCVFSYTNESVTAKWGYGVERVADFKITGEVAGTVTGLSCYYGNDYNIIGLVTDSSDNDRLAMNIYGDDGDVTADTLYGWNYLDFSVARVKKAAQYAQSLQTVPTTWGQDYYNYIDTLLKFIKRLPDNLLPSGDIPPPPSVDPQIIPHRNPWLTQDYIQELSAALNINFQCPFMCCPTGQPPILSIVKENNLWFYRLKPGTDFIDAQWIEAFTLNNVATTYGWAITTDNSTYIWISRPNGLYRARIPGYLAAPTITSTYSLQDYHNDSTAVTTAWGGITANGSGVYYKPSTDYIVRYLRLKLYRVGEPGTITLRFHNDFDSEAPADFPYSTTIDGDKITTDTDGAYYQFDLGEDVQCSTANDLFICLQCAYDASNYIRWQYATANAPLPNAYGVGARSNYSAGWIDTTGAGTFLHEIGAGYNFNTDAIISYEIQDNHHMKSTLDIVFDNSDDTYDSPGEDVLSVLQKGSIVRPQQGFKVDGVDYLQEKNQYFIENWDYSRAPNLATFTLHCIDAWGLMENAKLPAPVEFNLNSDAYTAYEIIEFLLKFIGATLTYDSRSTAMSTTYPQFDFPAGQTIASSVLAVLSLCPDLLRFRGLVGYLTNPQTTDAAEYEYYFP